MEELNKPNILLWEGGANVKHSTKVFSKEQIELIFNTVRNNKEDYWKEGHLKEWGDFYRQRDLVILHFIYYGALRPKEACCLKFIDVNLQNKTIFVSGLNNKRKKDRIVPLSKNILPELEKYLAYPQRFWKNSPYLFSSMMNDHISAGHLKMVMREKVLKKCGLYEPIDFARGDTSKVPNTRLYSLRKSRATHLLNASHDLYLVSNFLGHADVRTTANYYISESNEYNAYMKAAADGDINVMKDQKIINQNVEINQTNNFNVVIQQMQVMIQQQSEMINKLLQAQEGKTSTSNPLNLQEKPLPLE